MMRDNRRLDQFEVIESAAEFEWVAKKIADGFMIGKHASAKLGTGNEFQQYRAFVNGDDVRSIDWKMYAKTDKLFVKQSLINTEHRFMFYLDCSRSMQYKEEGRSKFMIAKLLIAVMMRIAANQGDQFAWSAGEQGVALSTGLRHWQHAIHGLFGLTASEQPAINPNENRRGSIAVWISDFYDSIDTIRLYLKDLNHPESDLTLMHLLGNREKRLNFGTNSHFVDLETGEQMSVNADTIRDVYTEQLKAHLQQVKSLAYEKGVGYLEVKMQDSLKQTIRNFIHNYQWIN